MEIYMDVCCLNRPFDDQRQDKIRLESAAIMAILFRCQKGEWRLIGSNIIDVELTKSPDLRKAFKVNKIANLAVRKIELNKSIELRALKYQSFGVDIFDSLHIACAEEANVDIFLTTDDKLIKRAKRFTDSNISVRNPVDWLMEVTSYEYDNN